MNIYNYRFPSLQKTNNLNISFGHKIAMDFGASDPRGTAKITSQLENNDVLNLNKDEKLYIINQKNGFESANHLISGVTELAINTAKEALENIKRANNNTKLAPNEEELTSVDMFFPGPVIGEEDPDTHIITNKIALIANYRDKDGESLENININDIEKALREKAEIAGIPLSQNFKLRVFKDLAGTGMAISEKLSNHPKYGEDIKQGRFHGAAIITGGGLGMVRIDCDEPNRIMQETSEAGHDMSMDTFKVNEERVGKVGATVSTVIKNFAEELAVLNKAGQRSNIRKSDIEALIKTGNATIATKKEIKLNLPNDEEAKEVLMKTGIYEEIKPDVLKVKNTPEADSRFKNARKRAVIQYADALAKVTIPLINRGVSVLVLTGPLAKGVRDIVAQNASDFTSQNPLSNLNIKSLSDLIKDRINYLTSHDNTIQKLLKCNGLNIECGGEFQIADNTTGAKVIRNPRTIISGNGMHPDRIIYTTDVFK
ncbi:MAG: hypothetical protein A2287_01245 [Candidatus Melainabacteria bacterium RIFOXYA12_FULL_32_12]|nr:MAG: hypothetical protein A2255_04990 [Candidatus Melainabacteria bacterium RIFOXYA2_FULL_32_9]OGI26818.1 MAG: hypothetical protein A2287_01245 [Candidatus Melainabacteria bacterium RIFOXYA12_FULL_32_12]